MLIQLAYSVLRRVTALFFPIHQEMTIPPMALRVFIIIQPDIIIPRTGAYALYSNTTGYVNTAIGVTTLNDNTTGYHNTAIGWQALLFQYNRMG